VENPVFNVRKKDEKHAYRSNIHRPSMFIGVPLTLIINSNGPSANVLLINTKMLNPLQ